MQAISFDETLKCLASEVFKLKVNLDHPPAVGSLHCWYTASMLQATYKGRIARRAAMSKRDYRVKVSDSTGLNRSTGISSVHEHHGDSGDVSAVAQRGGFDIADVGVGTGMLASDDMMGTAGDRTFRDVEHSVSSAPSRDLSRRELDDHAGDADDVVSRQFK